MIPLQNSKHCYELTKIGGKCLKCPIGKIDDIEIIFLHAHSEEEAREKWNRRKRRINWNNLLFKFSEQNNCKEEHLIVFDKFQAERKICFVSKDYHLQSQAIFTEYLGQNNVPNDTDRFRKYINLVNWINGEASEI